MHLARSSRWIAFSLLLLTAVHSYAVEPVQFVFRLPAAARDPLARDLWAEVITPSQATLHLPVFSLDGSRFAVRARASEPGDYRLGRVTEKIGDRVEPLPVTLDGRGQQRVAHAASLPQVTGVRGQPARFVFANGGTFVPIGANLAWPSSGGVKFQVRAIAEFGRQDLNWMRVWMAHWSGLNLDWLPPAMGASPAPGGLDERVAASWDRIVAAAEEQGVYLQIVLQHHGQYSSRVNSNWKENPWNAANPRGFLRTPGEFFTSPVAIDLTQRKFRYIVARWGYSPAVLAWELFNEVHWTDPINQDHDDATVAAWHAVMADYLHGIDLYRHLVTTSTENLRSQIYAKLDYDQPHLYAANLLAGVRQFDPVPAQLDRPVFYGEVGDDHLDLTPAQKAAGLAIVPPVWASLMGRGRYAAQPWLGEQLLLKGRLGELGAVARFAKAAGLGARDGLETFSPALECADRVPLVLAGSQFWQRRVAPDFTVPLDGREAVEFADIPRIFVSAPTDRGDGHPDRATYHVDFPKTVTLRARVVDTAPRGAAIRISVDGQVAAEKFWPAHTPGARAFVQPDELSFPVAAGAHTLVVENPGTADWFEMSGLDLGLDIPVLAAVGQRSADSIALWVWHRTGVFALRAPAPVAGTLLLEDVPAGRWQVTWWDTFKGVPSTPAVIEHPGGLLKLLTPGVNRHAAVVLTRSIR